MTTDPDTAFEEAQSAASGDMTSGLVEKILQRIGASATAAAVFGDPVERDGVTVIPVAKVRYGFGAGSGGGSDEGGEAGYGGGGGGGVSATPLGYIEIRGKEAEYVPIRDASTVWPMVLAAGVSAWFVLRGLRALFR